MKHLNSAQLVEKTKNLVGEERRITALVLEYLAEIERRRTFAEWGYPSLFEFCTKELCYSEAAAHRRISAMRLAREVPEVKEAIESGKLTLSTLSQAQMFFNQERKQGETYTPAEKRELLQGLEGKPRRECENELNKLAKNPVTEKELRFKASEALVEKLDRLKELLAGDPSLCTLIEKLADRALKELEPLPPAEVAPKTKRPESRYVPREVKRHVHQRDGGRCTFVSPQGKQCESRTGLQFDHVQPFAKGGGTRSENLRLLCPAHNRWEATQAFGTDFMAKFFQQSG